MSTDLTAHQITLAGRLDHINAAFAPGAITAICGPNGAGKSSLLGCLAGVITPDKGRVDLAGTELSRMAPRVRAQAIGYLPQSGDVAWDMSVETMVSLGRLPWRGAPAGEAAAAVAHALATMDLEHLRARPVSQLSGGERMRALVARVLAGAPRWLLADEPLAGLDLAHAAALMASLRAEAARGTGVLVVLHDLAMAMNHADRVLVLDHGRVAAAGPPAAALSPAVIARVWSVAARWHGPDGRQALGAA
jgi:iron complex transport system ATP-binding protein